MNLPDSFIQRIVSRLKQPDIIGIAMVGSYARGEGGQFSDVDLDIYVNTLPQNEYDRYTLHYWEKRLISLKYILLHQELAALSRPSEAIWAVPGLRQMRILVDDAGQLAELQRTAKNFQWKNLQLAANEYATEQLIGCAEETHKILSGLSRNEESTILYAVWGLIKGLASGVATQRGLLIESENRYFDIIQDSVGRNSEWTHSFRLALGADFGAMDKPPFKTRGMAALSLYRYTALLFEEIIASHHRNVVETTINLIQKAGY